MGNKINKGLFERSTVIQLPEAAQEKKQAAEMRKDDVRVESDATGKKGASTVLIKEVRVVVDAIKAGHLDARSDLRGMEGYDKEVLQGINDILDALVNPLKVAAVYVERISKGDIPEKITTEQNGDFNEIKNHLNTCIDAVNMLVSDSNMLSQAAVDGRLTIRADAAKHGGDFRKIVQGFNDTLDAVLSPMLVAASYIEKISRGRIPPIITDEWQGDFNAVKMHLNSQIDAINLLVSDANLLSQAALEGRLDTRADASKHGGDFAKIIEGVNATLDALLEPVQEASEVLAEMEKGNLNVVVRGDYKGDHALIKNALNNTLSSLLGYINEISYVLSELANGNLDVSIANDYRGDFSAIKESLNLIIDSFNEILGGIAIAADQVANASDQVASSSHMLAQGATEQSAAIEQLTASMTQIAGQTGQNANNADQANQLALMAKNHAVGGNERMKAMMEAIEAINESSGNISKIIKVIDDIAFQTNILALNAAVEAARAGQHGKGFAVVAEEVRNLAQRSASAAKETTDMIESSIKKTEAGTKIANETAQALVRIVEGVSQAADLVGNIAIASNEQATGIAQINKGVEQVSQVIQTNAATAEESASASEELSSQAELLKEQVGKFVLKKREPASVPSLLELTPEMIELLEEMLRSRQVQQMGVGDTDSRRTSQPGLSKRTISLSDNEFGKY